MIGVARECDPDLQATRVYYSAREVAEEGNTGCRRPFLKVYREHHEEQEAVQRAAKIHSVGPSMTAKVVEVGERCVMLMDLGRRGRMLIGLRTVRRLAH